MTDFSFPRDPDSAFDHITGAAIRASVLKLAEGLEDRFASDRHFDAIQRDLGGWNVVEVLRTGAVCVIVKGLDPTVDYDAALVRQGLIDHGFAPENPAPKI
jgi:hypothetical protein